MATLVYRTMSKKEEVELFANNLVPNAACDGSAIVDEEQILARYRGIDSLLSFKADSHLRRGGREGVSKTRGRHNFATLTQIVVLGIGPACRDVGCQETRSRTTAWKIDEVLFVAYPWKGILAGRRVSRKGDHRRFSRFLLARCYHVYSTLRILVLWWRRATGEYIDLLAHVLEQWTKWIVVSVTLHLRSKCSFW